MNKKRIILCNVVLLLNCSIQGYSQSIQLTLHELLYRSTTLKEWNVTDTALLQAFYKAQSENLFWQQSLPLNAKQPLLQLIGQSDAYGLNKADYRYDELVTLVEGQPAKTGMDSIKADVVFTDALLHFLCDIRYGHTPLLNYNGLTAVPDQQVLMRLLPAWVAATDKAAFLTTLEPHTKQYRALKALLSHFNTILATQSFREDSIISNKIAITNKPLLTKLVQLKLLDTTQTITNKKLEGALKHAQHQMNLTPNGKLNSLTIKALNVALKKRAEAVKTALNHLRWLHCFQEDSIAVINIPSATLYVYAKGNLINESRLVVGKKTTPTPTLSSYIQEVVLYPYWNVPYSIATKELLPKIKQDKGFLEANNFQVLNRQGKVLKPDTINWKQFDSSSFPYLIRQSTGCDNSLGLVKFNFSNPFSVYLHDTPEKGLFARKKRYFSHGCMRVEHPVVLAELLLQEEKATIKRLTANCLKDQKPTVLPVKNPMPVVVLYNTVWYDSNGNILFFDDVYGN